MVISGFGQTSRDVAPIQPPAKVYPTNKQTKKKLFASKKKRNHLKTREEEIKDFRARIKKVGKEKAKIAKKMDKPQYTDFSYFGHKKPPIKRPPGKRKFCKECGIRH
jgi:hypothetical protein